MVLMNIFRGVGKTRGGNRSISDTINTLGGGPDVFKTLSTVEGNCGGITS